MLEPRRYRLRPPRPARVLQRRPEVGGEAGGVGGDVADDGGADGVGEHAAGEGAEAAVLALVHGLVSSGVPGWRWWGGRQSHSSGEGCGNIGDEAQRLKFVGPRDLETGGGT